MSILTALQRFFGASSANVNGSAYNYSARVSSRVAPVELPPAALYHLLRRAYLTNGLYDDLKIGWAAAGYTPGNLKPIRNVVSAVVDVLGAKVFPDPLVITTPRTQGITSQIERARAEERDPIKSAIEQVWAWGNWDRNRRLFGRYVALFGEAYLRVVASPERGRVYYEVISPEHVTDFETDERGYLTMFRLDIPQTESTRAGTRHYTWTELWEHEQQRYRSWQTEGDASVRQIEDLGLADADLPLSEFGIDFIPVSRAVFRDIGEKRGIGAVQLAVEAIIEADLSATNLHSMVYTDAEGAWVLKAVGLDAQNRPLPPPVVGAASADGQNGRQSDNTVQVGKRSFWRLGGNQELQSVIPDIDYAGALAILQDHDAHLERLMPALSYIKISELTGGDLSGKAITYKMRAFVDQVEEGRSNVLASLKQADMMALTMGQAAGVFGSEIGNYDAGDFEHDFDETPILHISTLDEAEEKRTTAQAAQALASAGIPMSVILTDTLAMSEQEATGVIDQAADEAEQAFERQQELAAAQPAQENDDAA